MHAWLCYPAATCRGYPPLNPFWESFAIYLGFLGVAFAPAFDDFDDRPAVRRFALGTFAGFACLVLGVALANLGGARPHIGHLAGYWGVVRYDWPMVVVCAAQSAIIAVPFVFCLESVARALWSLLRRFPTAGHNSPSIAPRVEEP